MDGWKGGIDGLTQKWMNSRYIDTYVDGSLAEQLDRQFDGWIDVHRANTLPT
jgi:hypothetical protein